MIQLPQQSNLNDVPDCLRTLADGIEADRAMADVSVLVLLREPDTAALSILSFGRDDPNSMAAFTECHIAAAQLLELMRPK